MHECPLNGTRIGFSEGVLADEPRLPAKKYGRLRGLDSRAKRTRWRTTQPSLVDNHRHDRGPPRQTNQLAQKGVDMRLDCDNLQRHPSRLAQKGVDMWLDCDKLRRQTTRLAQGARDR